MRVDKVRSFVPVILLAIVALLCPGWVAAAPILFNFDHLTGMSFWAGTPIPSQAQLSTAYLSTYGVSFSSGSPFVAVVDLGVGHATSGQNGIGGSRPTGELTYDRMLPIVAEFFDPDHPAQFAVTDYVSVRGDSWGGGQLITLNAFDKDGILMDSFTTVDSGGATLTVSKPGIHAVQFLGTQDSGGVALDDFAFNAVSPVSPVPEPSTLLLLGSGLAGLGGMVWKRQPS